jgi:hypothetical protein
MFGCLFLAQSRGDRALNFLTGVIFGVLLTVVAVFFIDQKTLASGAEPRATIVNWDVVGDRAGSLLDAFGNEVYNLLHK